MNKVFGTISEFTPVREEGSRIVISYGMESVDENNATWKEVYLPKKQTPSICLKDVRDAIINDIDASTEEKIISGFVWNGLPVWLSNENQFNFKAAYDLAVQLKGSTLPITFKLGESPSAAEEGSGNNPVYFTFEDMQTFKDFYTKSVTYINQCLIDGWKEKDDMDWGPYEEIFAEGGSESATE